ncbi:MAG: sortase [Rhodoferax sp.]|nr:sortase [Actinomycetota bacterium]
MADVWLRRRGVVVDRELDDAPTAAAAVDHDEDARRGAAPAPPRPVRRPLAPLTASASVGLWSVAMVSGLCLWLVFSATVLGAMQYRADQGRLYDDLRVRLANGTAPLGATTSGTPVALLNARGAGIRDAVVVEGTSSVQTQKAPGHRRNTPLPGQPGVSVLLGRGTTYGAAFGGIARLDAGDVITATTGQGDFTFVVEGVRRAGDPLPALLPFGGSRLSLASTEGASLANGLRARGVVYVDAILKGTPRLPSSTRPSAIPANEDLMAGNRSAVLPLLLWMQALLVVGCAVAWAQARWGLWQTWLAAAPALLLVLWAAATSAAQLLPNLF